MHTNGVMLAIGKNSGTEISTFGQIMWMDADISLFIFV